MTKQGTTYTTRKTIEDQGIPTNPYQITITLTNPDNTIIIDKSTPTNDSTGEYHHTYTFPSNAALGLWIWTWTITMKEGDTPITSTETVTITSTDTPGVISDVLDKLDKNIFSLSDGSVTLDEINQCKTSATYQTTAYLELTDTNSLPTGEIVSDALITWAAGLLWNMKVNTEAPNYQEDKKGETEGDKLIQRAKDLLTPFKREGVSGLGDYTRKNSSTEWYDKVQRKMN